MFAIIAIILVIVIVALELRNSASTANLSTSGNSTDNATDNLSLPPQGASDNSIGSVDFSPLDIGGLSLNIPNAVLQWRSLAERYAQIHSILDPEEILAIIWNESSGNPNAQNPNDPSWGLMGVTLLIGKAYGGFTTSQEIFVPENNISVGSAYLAHLKSRFGDSSDWSESYNEGETNYSAGKHYNPGYSQAFNSHLNALKGLG